MRCVKCNDTMHAACYNNSVLCNHCAGTYVQDSPTAAALRFTACPICGLWLQLPVTACPRCQSIRDETFDGVPQTPERSAALRRFYNLPPKEKASAAKSRDDAQTL